MVSEQDGYGLEDVRRVRHDDGEYSVVAVILQIMLLHNYRHSATPPFNLHVVRDGSA